MTEAGLGSVSETSWMKSVKAVHCCTSEVGGEEAKLAEQSITSSMAAALMGSECC